MTRGDEERRYVVLERARSQGGDSLLYEGAYYCMTYGTLRAGLYFEGWQHEMRGNFCAAFEITTSYSKCMNSNGSYYEVPPEQAQEEHSY